MFLAPVKCCRGTWSHPMLVSELWIQTSYSYLILAMACVLFNFEQVYTNHIPLGNREMRLICAEACRSSVDSKITQITNPVEFY